MLATMAAVSHRAPPGGRLLSPPARPPAPAPAGPPARMRARARSPAPPSSQDGGGTFIDSAAEAEAADVRQQEFFAVAQSKRGKEVRPRELAAQC